jgi:hypothetical protein
MTPEQQDKIQEANQYLAIVDKIVSEMYEQNIELFIHIPAYLIYSCACEHFKLEVL